MFNYLAFLYGGLSAPSGDATADGAELARQCLAQLQRIDNQEQFPPRLLILLVSPAYLNRPAPDHLLAGVRQAFAEAGHREVQIIGSSVSAVFFDRQTHEQGALLVCLASRVITVNTAVEPNARQDANGATSRLLDALELNSKERVIDPNPLVNRLLLTFLPGKGAPGAQVYNPAPDLHRLLRDKVSARVPIVGGASANDNRSKPCLQFANTEVFTDAIVAARITTGSPFCSSIGKGLDETRRFLRVKHVADDGRTVTAFAEGRPSQALGLRRADDVALLGQLSLNRDPIVTSARLAADGKSAVLLRECRENALFEILKPNAQRTRDEATKLISRSLKRLRIENVVGCLAIHCAGRRAKEPDVWQMTADIPELRGKDVPYVGGFFDGEFGQDNYERSIFGNWCFVVLCFGDELRERDPLYSGFHAIARYTPKLTPEVNIDQAIEKSLQLIYETGFPGAMLSLVLDNETDGPWIVGRKAKGSRLEKIVEMTQRPFTGQNILVTAAKEKSPSFISDSRKNPLCDPAVVKKSGIISQYVMPLCNLHGEPVAVLQIDLGDSSYKPDLHGSDKRVLESLGDIIGSTLLRLLSREEIHIARDLDKALQNSLAAGSTEEALQRYIESAIKIFGVESGYIRLVRPGGQALTMAAGDGFYYEALRQVRRTIGVEGGSPTALAYRRNNKVVVNDAAKDQWHLDLCIQHQRDEAAHAALTQIGSYANVSIKDGDGTPVGTISLLTRRPWAFTRPMVRSLDFLSQRVGFLIEHMRRKRHLEFLFDVGPQFVRTANFNDPDATLRDAVIRFRQAANADLACLFLRDPELQRFVLYAEEGWRDHRWLHVARYQEGERFTGRVAKSDQPVYIPDLFAYKQAAGITEARNYAVPMFGRDLSPDFTFEAIGLPLKVKAETIGVLTLYRRIEPGQASGFTTTDDAVLREAANNMAAMVSHQRYYTHVLWEKAERQRQDEFCELIQQDQRGLNLEQKACLQFLRIYRGLRVDYYSASNKGGAPQLSWVTGYRRLPQETPLPPSHPDEILRSAAAEKITYEKRRKLAEYDWDNLEEAQTEGRIERVCLPLLDEDQLVGMLDVRFGVKRAPSTIQRPHNREQLELVCKRFVDIRKRQQAAAQERKAGEQAERSQMAVQAMGAMVFQTAHRLMNLVQELYDMPDLITAADTEEQRRRRISQLEILIRSAGDKIQRPMEVARRVKSVSPQLFPLRVLVDEVVAELNPGQLHGQIAVSSEIPAELSVWSDRELIREAFHNIMNNAVKAMPGGGMLNISAHTRSERNLARIIFEDNGKGMSQSEIEAAKLGFVSTQTHTGLGVLVSILLSRATGGDLEIESEVGSGTKVTVTLPLSPAEDSS
jgi:signal transduction histidine kinase/GAF domain-containing protein